MEKNSEKAIIPHYLLHMIRTSYGKIINIEEEKIALTNKVFKIDTETKSIVLKILSKNKSVLANKINEVICINTFAKKNITPRLLDYKLPRYFILEHIAPKEISVKKDFTHALLADLSENTIENLAHSIGEIHHSDIRINQRNYVKTSLSLLKNVEKRYLERPLFQESTSTLFDSLKTLDKFPKEYAPCHNDLNLNNLIIDRNNKAWLLDFEYASINDVYFDLATLKNTLSQKNFEDFCYHYFTGKKHKLDDDKLQFHRKTMDLLSILWCYAFSYDKMAERIFNNYQLSYS